MMVLTDWLFLLFFGVGARMSISKWNRSHQNMSEWLLVEVWTMVLIIVVRSLLKRFLLFPVRNRLHVDRKYGGSPV